MLHLQRTMKKIFFCISFFMLFVSVVEATELFLTVKGRIYNADDNTVVINYPLNFYPNIDDTTKKYTIYTDSKGYYFFSYPSVKLKAGKILIATKSLCKKTWINYTDTVMQASGKYTHNFSICLNTSSHLRDFMVFGYVREITTLAPMYNYPVYITKNSKNMSSVVKVYTNFEGYYHYNFLVNDKDSLNYNVNSYATCQKETNLITHSINRRYIDKIQKDFEVCNTNTFDWSVTYFHYTNKRNNKTYLFYIGNEEADSVIWECSGIKLPKGTEISYLFEEGDYYVTMLAYKDGVCQTVRKHIVVGRTLKLSGKVYVSDIPLKQGYLVAVNKKTKSYTTYPIHKGKFLVDDIVRGDYYIYAVPEIKVDTVYFPKYIATYYGNEAIWQDAEVLTVDKDKFIRIDLLKNNQKYYGTNSIRIKIDRKITLKYNIVNMLLYDSNGRLINSLSSQLGKEFLFKFLPDGYYTLKTEIPMQEPIIYSFYLKSGIGQSVNYYVDNLSNIYFTADQKEIDNNKSFCIYPNPFDNFISIKSDLFPLSLDLYDTTGKLVFSEEEVYDNNVLINGLNSGIYCVVLKSKNLIVSRQILLKQ